MRFVSCLLMLCCYSVCFGQNYSLDDFKEGPIPERESSAWYALNQASNKEFVFTIDGGKIKVSKYSWRERIEFDIPQGRLVGINRGEFGGGLYFLPKDSTKTFFVNGKDSRHIEPSFFFGLIGPDKPTPSLKLLQSGVVNFFLPFKDSLYFTTGLAHLGGNFGNLYRFSASADSFFISRALDIGSAPSAYAVFDGKVYMATQSAFLVIDQQLNKRVLFDELFWRGLYPISVVVPDETTALVTIRGGYVKINLADKTMKMYKAK